MRKEDRSIGNALNRFAEASQRNLYDFHPIEADRQHTYDGHELEYSYISDVLDSFLAEASQRDITEVLDLASGTGEVANAIECRGFQTIRLDINNLAITRQHSKNPFIKLIEASAWKLPLQSGVIQAIHMKDALTHIADRNLFFSEVQRILIRKGIFIAVSAVHMIPQPPIYFVSHPKSTVNFAKNHGFRLLNEWSWTPQHPSKDWYHGNPDGTERFVLLFEKK